MIKKHFSLFIVLLVIVNLQQNYLAAQPSWNPVTSPQSGYDLNGIYFLDVNTGVADRWKTTDGGSSWYQTNSAGCYAMVFSNSLTGYRVSSGIRKTTNLGETWISQINPTSGDILYGVHFPNDNTGYACGEFANIIKTTNSGANWYILLSGISTSFILRGVFSVDENITYVSGSKSGTYESVILKTINSGVNWSAQNFSGGTGFQSIFFSNSNTGFVGGAGKIYKTTDAGSSWIEKTSPSGSFLKSIIFKSPNTGYMAGWGGTIIKTTDGGETWFRQTTGTGSDLESVYFLNDNTGFVCGDNGIVLKTTDGGGPPIGITPIGNEVPEKFSLLQNYPNPFNPATNINFSIPQKSYVKIIIYDAAGKVVDQLVNFELNAGTYKVDWSATNFPSGVYFYSLQAGNYKESRKMILIK